MFKNTKIQFDRYFSIVLILLLVIPAFFVVRYLGPIGVYIGSALYMLIGMLGLWEVIVSFGFDKYLSVIPSLLIIPFFLADYNSFDAVVHLGPNTPLAGIVNLALSFKSYLFIFMMIIPICLEPKVAKAKLGYFTTSFVLIVVGIIASTFFKGLWALNTSSLLPVFFFLPVAIIADSFGYFGGKYLGKYIFKNKKLAPSISPKKTWAGAVVGFIFSFAFASIAGYYMNIWVDINVNQIAISIVLGLFLSLISPLGDLLFSAIKRRIGVKDFSNLLPGHGGVFDRIDAMSIVLFTGCLIYLLT